MLIHLFEVVLNGVVLFAGPLMLVAAMAGLLTLIDRLYHALWGSLPDMHPRGVRNVSTSLLTVLNHATPYCPNWVKSLNSVLGPAEGWARAHRPVAAHKEGSREIHETRYSAIIALTLGCDK
jgi:hypothetical protein